MPWLPPQGYAQGYPPQLAYDPMRQIQEQAERQKKKQTIQTVRMACVIPMIVSALNHSKPVDPLHALYSLIFHLVVFCIGVGGLIGTWIWERSVK